jgi:uncharacterized protein YggE
MRFTFLMGFVLAAHPAFAQQPMTPAAMPAATAHSATITVSAHGDTSARPDRVRIALGVQTTARTAGLAVEQNARLQSAVLDTLRALGIPAAQLRTIGYSLYPERAPDRGTGEPAAITGYTASNTVQVDLKRVDLVGSVIDASVGRGANGVSSLEFYIADPEPLHRAALAEAVRIARSSADAIAHAAGGRLGRLLEIAAGTGVRPILAAEAMARGQAYATPVESGEQTVSADISATWEFIAGR